MAKYIDKPVIENILHKLWKKDTGFENIDIARIAYNRALQDVQCEIDTIEVQEEPVSEDLEKAAKQYSFYIPTQCEATETWKKETEQHFKDGAKWQLAKNKSITLDDLGEFINELSKQFPEVSFAKVCKIATRTAKWLLDVELPKLEED